MAESLVLANVSIDSSGVAAGSKSALAWMTRLTLGVGGITGAVLLLRRGLSTAVDSAIELDRKMGGEMGIAKTMDGASRAAHDFAAALGAVVLGSKTAQEFIDGLTGALNQMAKALNRAAGVNPRTMRGLVADPRIDSLAGSLGKVQEKLQADAEAKRLKEMDLVGRFMSDENTTDQFMKVSDATLEWRNHLDDVFNEIDRIVNDAIPDLVDGMDVATERWQAFWEVMAEGSEMQRIQMDALLIGTAGIGNALAEGAISGRKAMKEALAGMLKDMARMLMVRAIESLAVGILASTPYGQMLGLGPPEPYFAAAAKFAAGGLAAGVAARAIGSSAGGGSSRGGSGGGRGADSGMAARGGSNITIIVQGSMIGTNPDSLARDLNRLITTNKTDGAR